MGACYLSGLLRSPRVMSSTTGSRSAGTLAGAIGAGQGAQIDGLGRDDQLDGGDPGAELGHVGQAARGQRRHGGPVLDALALTELASS